MDTISKNPENWLKFDFPAGCVSGNENKNSQRRAAAKSLEGGCCPYYFCFSAKHGYPCDSKAAAECAKRCEEFYEKYIKGGEK